MFINFARTSVKSAYSSRPSLLHLHLGKKTLQPKDNINSVVDNAELANVDGSHGVKLTKVANLSSPVSGVGHFVL